MRPNPATLPVCSNTMDDDSDGQTDFPADYGCSSAGGTSEVFCTGETDPTALITTKTTTGTTTGKSNDHQPMLCSLSSSSAASDVAYALQLPVSVVSLQVDTINSSFDTMIYFRDTQCTTDARVRRRRRRQRDLADDAVERPAGRVRDRRRRRTPATTARTRSTSMARSRPVRPATRRCSPAARMPCCRARAARPAPARR